MNKLAVGILAHVDAGKTTLSEALLYRSGALRTLGRVDHQDAFLDTDHIERERGITIFSKQAILPLEGLELTLLDTPGHADFSSEMERTLQVLDYAILVISGTDMVQGHTQTLWRLLTRYRIPTFLFVNKMDLAGTDRSAVMESLKGRLSESCVDFSESGDSLWESVAMCGEAALSQYLEHGQVEEAEVAALIRRRQLFPCYFGSALKLEGIDGFLDGIRRFARRPDYSAEFGAKVFKIARDPQGNRLTYLKITGGSLKVKALLSGGQSPETWSEKVDQIRIYSGAKFVPTEEAEAGTVCAVTGLSRTRPGDGLGAEPPSPEPVLSAVLAYRLLLPKGCDPHSAWSRLVQLEEEDPQLHIVWNDQLREIHLQLMGEIQLEILKRQISERFGLSVEFGPGSIVYRETIAAPVEGVGHFEPLRHYAEVHLLLEPGEPGSGLHFASVCGEDVLDKSWQHLVLTHLKEKTHLGVLTGSPITDMKITLTAGRAHVKHTEGGDFRQATYRAVRQGLMGAQNILLEPWYDFQLELPAQYVGRAMSDLQRMSGQVEPPQAQGEVSLLTGCAPVSKLQGYASQVTAYTRGLGRLLCDLRGYQPCHNQEEVVASIGYDCQRDVDNPADSVFCSHGAGVVVKWNEVPARMHLPSFLRPQQTKTLPQRRSVSAAYTGSAQQDKELAEIFERTYGPVKRRDPFRKEPPQPAPPEKRPIRPADSRPEYLLVDGYNIIFAWDELKAVAQDSLDAARKLLMDLLSNYQGYRKCVVILVFDAYKVPGNPGSVSRYHNIHVVYTKEAETADAYIERVTYEIGREHRVRVATSDGPEQLIILGHGALRVPASAFHAEVEQVEGQIAAILERNNRREKSRAIQAALERAEQEK
ncbi:TetM/TetW/TetO/TetS family tetracycline resistance ribosomal protection protein [Oscillibacter sp. MSJ-2]|uniref:TetM/TetW/TetO/TetS family tetracycline resistance ribosomal protection protein n=1 Tax=Dysosmobacter acutus TaxID=2841504 RepID=A0ABS6FBF8_9FIRM|nr:TetM/TetW/TetO/TetS family tetracycline resistance ribosomal protection protein [Dysosmobacter acutus]MBU5626902.1 TetM/TetW/TetO/TetS family tetracycline resistance ribosomal protection protein [Dysosmobacter acutus]